MNIKCIECSKFIRHDLKEQIEIKHYFDCSNKEYKLERVKKIYLF